MVSFSTTVKCFMTFAIGSGSSKIEDFGEGKNFRSLSKLFRLLVLDKTKSLTDTSVHVMRCMSHFEDCICLNLKIVFLIL